jgi:hypothetical protein
MGGVVQEDRLMVVMMSEVSLSINQFTKKNCQPTATYLRD